MPFIFLNYLFKMSVSIHILVAAVLATAVCMECALPYPSVKTCGLEHKCEAHYYCNDVDTDCRPCEPICNEVNPNYSREHCEEKCQDYLHDSLYLPRDQAVNFATKSDVATIMALLWTFIVVTLMTSLVIIFLAAYMFVRKSKFAKKKQQTINTIAFTKQPPLKVETAEIENNENNNKRKSVKLEREPSESELPEYSAYDNPAMSHSPMHTV